MATHRGVTHACAIWQLTATIALPRSPAERANRRSRLRAPSLSARKAGAQEYCSSEEAGEQHPQMEVS